MAADGILLCDVRPQERSWCDVTAAAAGTASCVGGAARLGGGSAGRDAGGAGAPVRQGRLPVRRRRTARPVYVLHRAPAGPRPGQVCARGGGGGGAPLPAAG